MLSKKYRKYILLKLRLLLDARPNFYAQPTAEQAYTKHCASPYGRASDCANSTDSSVRCLLRLINAIKIIFIINLNIVGRRVDLPHIENNSLQPQSNLLSFGMHKKTDMWLINYSKLTCTSLLGKQYTFYILILQFIKYHSSKENGEQFLHCCKTLNNIFNFFRHNAVLF